MARRVVDNTLVKTQEKIIARFGRPAIAAATQRLCTRCPSRVTPYGNCNLLPITTEGKDCPYHTPFSQPGPEASANG